MALFFMIGLFVLPGLAETQPYEYFLCSNKNFVRSLRIDVLTDKTCMVKYSKGGIDHEVGSGLYMESCQKFLNNVKTNLEEAGWNCRKLDSVKMSLSK